MKLSEIVTLDNKSIKPQDSILYNHYSLPAFDDNMTYSVEKGSDIKSSKYLVPASSILFSKLNVRFKRIWNINGKTSDIDICSTEFLPLVIKDENKVDKDYVYHFLTSNKIIETLSKASTGTSNSHQRISPDMLMDLEITLPSIDEQKKISKKLNYISNKIHVNRKNISMLEKELTCYYKRFFVNYEFNNGELPKNWVSTNVGSVINELNTRIGNDKAEVLTVINSGELVKQADYFNKDVHSKDIKKYKVIDKYDFAYNTARINIGSIGMFKEDYKAVVSPIYVAFSVEDNYHWFFEQFVRDDDTKEQIIKRCSGSVRQALNLSDFGQIQIVYPDKSSILKFNKLANKIKRLLAVYVEENNLLQTYLDKLIEQYY